MNNHVSISIAAISSSAMRSGFTSPIVRLMLATSFALSGWMWSAVRADVITDWNNTAIIASRSDSATTYLMVTRVLAMVHVAQFDAVNAILGRYSPYLVNIAAPAASPEAAAAQAAHTVLIKLFPRQSISLNRALTNSLNAVPDGSAKSAGVTLGLSVGDAIFRLRESDGSTLTVTYRPRSGLGNWVPTPPDMSPGFAPHWRHITPWTLRSPSQFRPPPPLAPTNAQYAADVNEVKLMGKANSSARTALQTEIARFHDDVHVFTLGHAARDVVNRHPMPLDETARLFALMYLAAADASIACWEAKYTYGYWRPITAIRGAADDENPETAPEAGWEPLLPTPPHPEYPSGHASAIGAGTTVLAALLGDEFTFTTTSSVVPNKPHTFDRFSDLANEVINARVYAGVHFRTANVNATIMGGQIAQHVVRNFLVPGPSLEGVLESGEFRLHQRTTGPLKGRIEYSTDLVTWQPLIDYTRADLSVQIRDGQAETNRYRFYRSFWP